jgi:hypothetical protein
MKLTEQIEDRVETRGTGLFALLCGSPRVEGTGAPGVPWARRLLVSGLTTLSGLAVLFALAATPALAEQARIFTGSFGGVASTTPDPYPLARPEGDAVDESNGDVYVANNAVNDIQLVDVHATGGTFELVFENPLTHETKTTVPIVFTGEAGETKSDEAVQSALENAGAGAGNVHVTGATFEYKIEFIGALTGVDVATMTAQGAGLTGAGATVNVSTAEHGLPGDDVEKFGPSGEFILMFGRQVNKTAVMLSGTEAEQDLCTAVSGDVCGGGVGGTTPGAFVHPEFVAVDSSTGDVYVADSWERGDGLVSKFNENGVLIPTWGDNGPGESPNGQLVGPKGSPAEHFTAEISGIAVDSSGNLWVDGFTIFTTSNQVKLRAQRLFEFSPNASLETAWTPSVRASPNTPFFPELEGISVDAEDNLYLPKAGEPTKVDPGGTEIGQIVSNETLVPGDHASGFAVDSSGRFYLDTEKENILAFASCHPEVAVCTPTESFGAAHLLGSTAGLKAQGKLAVDSASPGDTVFADQEEAAGQVFAFSNETVPTIGAGKPSGLTSTSATLNATVNPAGVALTECYFEYGETEAYGLKAPCEAPAAGEVPADSNDHPVHAAVTGLHQGKTYHYRLVAANANDGKEPSQGQDIAFGAPVIDSESTARVTATTATAQAEIRAENVASRFRVEYGTSAAYGQSTPETDIGSGASAQSVASELHGLSAGTLYHYRFVAENVLGEGAAAVDGPDHTFTTQTAGGFTLPDGRQWEMVSPADRHGSSPEPLAGVNESAEGVTQAAADGSALTYLANAPIEPDPAGYGEFDQILASRGPAGWSSHDLGIPHAGSTDTSFDGLEYRFFSEDLSAAVVQPFGPFLALSPQASEQTAYLNDLHARSFTPLVTGCPQAGESCPPAIEEHANVPAGTVFGQQEVGFEGLGHGSCPPNPLCGPSMVGATPDLTHVVLSSGVGLSAGHGHGLYEWSGGALTFLTTGEIGTGSFLNDGVGGARHAISNDGSRVVFSELIAGGQGNHLYLRDTATEKTIQLDAVEAGCPAQDECGTGHSTPEFEAASSSGSRVFFLDAQKLTAAAHAYPGDAYANDHEGEDLYECEIREDACELRDLTPAGAVAATTLGVSEDGSWVYFAARAVLGDGAAQGATPGTCDHEESPPSSHCNLYVYHDGETRFIAALSIQDYSDWGGAGRAQVHQTARVSPDGQWLAFMSERSLTGYDNRDAATGQPDQEVYLYDAQTGRLTCASCNPTGARPTGAGYRDLELGAFDVWEHNPSLAAYLPPWAAFADGRALYQPRYLSDDGRLFFDAVDGLVPRDVNGQGDVYEYEPEGVGPQGQACAPAADSGSLVFKPARVFEAGGQSGEEAAGCVSLISSGASARESVFLDASESGGDVFFLTTSHLVPQDVEGGLAVYDAHECSSASPCFAAEQSPPPPCTTADACRQSATPQPEGFGAPASATFSGAGNVTPLPPTKQAAKKTVKCKKSFVKNKKGKCIKRPKKKKSKAKRATSDRRASR